MRRLAILGLALAACGAERPAPLPVGAFGGAAVAVPADAISASELEGHLDSRMVLRIFPRSRDTVEVQLCDGRRLVAEMSPREAQAEMLERAYRPGCA